MKTLDIVIAFATVSTVIILTLCAIYVAFRLIDRFADWLVVTLAKRELDRAYNELQTKGGLNAMARYAKACNRYYFAKYPDADRV
jgi:biopolymer transport protein ExbB/TolQ